MFVSAVVVAGGRGTRLGSQGSKALVELAGEPLVVHAVRAMWASEVVNEVVVVGPSDDMERDVFSEALQRAGLDAHIVPGGVSRQASVASGLSAINLDADYILIHDAARPLVPADVVQRVVGALQAGHRGVVPALAVTDTIKRVSGEARPPHPAGFVAGPAVEAVAETLDRSVLRAMQTPQGFERETILAAHREGAALAADEATSAPDDAALVEALGIDVVLVQGSQRAMKITHPYDLSVAELLAAAPGLG